MSEAINVIKQGEMRVQVVLSRSPQGVLVRALAHPHVEEFMQRVGGGETVNVTSMGRHWIPLNKDVPLLAYTIPPMEPIIGEDGVSINIDLLGRPLTTLDERRGNDSLNLSFLRLVGISEGAGVQFGVKGVYTTTELRRLRDRMQLACQRLYNEYLRPVDVTFTLNAYELRL